MPKTPLLSYLSAGLLFLYAILQMTVFNSISGALQTSFGLSAVQLGNISSLYFYCAAIALIPYGLLLDYYPTRRPTLVMLGLCVFSGFLFALHPALLTAGIYRIICGLTNPLVFLVCMRQAPMWFPRKVSLAISIIITIGMLGGMIQYPFSMIMDHFGWQTALLYDAGLGLFLFILSCFFLKDKPTPLVHHITQVRDILQHFKTTLTIKENWLGGIFTGFLNWPVMVLGALWGNQYLILNQGFSESTASFIVSMIFFGMIFASPFFGWFADACGSRKRAMLIGALASILSVVLIVLTDTNSVFVFAGLFFLLGFTCTSQIISYTVINEINGSGNTSTAMSLCSVLIYLIGGLGNPIFGGVVAFFLHQGDSSIFASNMGMFSLMIGFSISLLASLFIKRIN